MVRQSLEAGVDITMDPIPRVADNEHLTEVFRRSRAIDLARVANVAAIMSSLKKLRSHTLRLRLDYEGSIGDALNTISSSFLLPRSRDRRIRIAAQPSVA